MSGALTSLRFPSSSFATATLAVNSPDFTRYTTTNRAQWSQALAIPLSVRLALPLDLEKSTTADYSLLSQAFFVTICGILAASASIPVYGLTNDAAYWSP